MMQYLHLTLRTYVQLSGTWILIFATAFLFHCSVQAVTMKNLQGGTSEDIYWEIHKYT